MTDIQRAQQNLNGNDDANNVFSLTLVNKRFPNRPIRLLFREPSTVFEMKQKMLPFFHKNTKDRISGFRLVREGNPDDDIDDALPNNYLDDQYNDMQVSEFKQLIEDNQLYNNNLIYFRTILIDSNTRNEKSKN